MHSLPSPVRLLAVALLSSLLAVMGSLVLQTGLASGAPPAPITIVVTGVSSGTTAPAGTPSGAVPSALVEAGEAFYVDVRLHADGAPASFNKDTALSITTSTGAANAPSPATGVAPKGASEFRLTTSLPHPANQVQVTVSEAGAQGPKAAIPGTSTAFDVLKEVRVDDVAVGAPYSRGIGGEEECKAATTTDPVCGVLLLPAGASGPQVLLSLGACDSAYAGCQSDQGSVVQALADLGDLYEPTSPAALLVKCDKDHCGGGAISDMSPNYTLLGNAPLTPAPACPGKNTLGPGQEVCVDYVQSRRDGSGDTWLYFLLTKDARVSVR